MSTRNSTHKCLALLVTVVAALSTLSACAEGEGEGVKTSPKFANELAAFTMRSGTWRVRPSEGGFLWTLDENPGWSSAMACNDTEQPKVVNVGNWSLLVPQHACKFAQDESPVQMDGNLIRSAVNAGRWVGYDAEIAKKWPTDFGMPDRFTGSLKSYAESRYDPAGMNGTSTNDNIVGVISAAGGEHPTSRGSVDEADAQLITKAMNGESISQYTTGMYNIAFAHAGYPYQTPFTGTMLRDPQKPSSGLQFEHKINDSELTDEVYSVNPEKDWKSKPSHLFNVGWALWLATEDPRIGMLVQSSAQFSMATYHEYFRLPLMPDEKGNMTDYRCNVDQDRSIYNCLNAMWKARDVAQKTRSNDVMLWSLERTTEMYKETAEQIQGIMDKVSNATLEEPSLVALNAVSSPFDRSHCGVFRRTDASEFVAVAKSNFEDAHYGSVPMYLRAKNGEALGINIISKVANHMVARVLYVGGAAGVDGRRDVRGSSLPLGPCVKNGQYLEAAPLPYANLKEWAAWVDEQDIVTGNGDQPSTENLNLAGAPNTVQIAFILDAAKQLESERKIAAVTDLDAAIDALDLARKNTSNDGLRYTLWNKHLPTLIAKP